MGQFLLNLSDLDEKIIRNYAMHKVQDPSQLIRNIVISTIEDEIDLEHIEKLIIQHRKSPDTVTFDEMMKELDMNA
ncbi:DUF6290 family protein [Macrococcus capreoli]